MSRLAMLATLCLVACQQEEARTFGSGGSGMDGEISSDDTGEAAEGAPVITALESAFEDYADLGTVLVTRVYFTDEDGDVDGGKVWATLESSGGETEDVELDIDGEFAIIQDDEYVQFVVSGLNTSQSYGVTVQLEDASGNISEAEEASVE